MRNVVVSMSPQIKIIAIFAAVVLVSAALVTFCVYAHGGKEPRGNGQAALFAGAVSCLIGAVGLGYALRVAKRWARAEKSLAEIRAGLELQVCERASRLREANASLWEEISIRLQAEEELRRSEERYRRLVETTPLGLFAMSPDMRLVEVNEAACVMLGRSAGDLVGQDFFTFTVQADESVREARAVQRLRAGRRCYEITLRRKDGRLIDALVNAASLFDAEGGLTGSLALVTDITERKQAEKLLAIQRDLGLGLGAADTLDAACRALLDAACQVETVEACGVFSLDESGAFAMTGGAPRMAEWRTCASSDPSGPPPLDAVADLTALVRAGEPAYGPFALWPAGVQAFDSAGDQAAAFIPIKPEGALAAALVAVSRRSSPLPRAARQALETLAAQFGTALARLRAETARRAAEAEVRASLQEKEALLREIHHRVKNNLQTISSLLSLQAASISDPEAARVFLESRNRIRSMALVHEKLYGSANLSQVDFGDYLGGMAAHLLMACQVQPGRVSLAVEARCRPLPVDQAIPCGIIVNELITNALRHAFPDGRPGRIETIMDELPGNLLRLRVRDDGRGFPADFDIAKAQSLGLVLVSSLTSQLKGELRLNGAPGALVEIVFPARGDAAPSPAKRDEERLAARGRSWSAS